MAEKTVPTINNEGNVVKREITRNPELYASPLVDIYETEDGLTVLADLPGVDKDGLRVNVENGILTIEGKVKPRDDRNYLLREFEPVNFFRQFELPDMIHQEKIGAELKNGVLSLNLPKAEAAKPRQIQVKIS